MVNYNLETHELILHPESLLNESELEKFKAIGLKRNYPLRDFHRVRLVLIGENEEYPEDLTAAQQLLALLVEVPYAIHTLSELSQAWQARIEEIHDVGEIKTSLYLPNIGKSVEADLAPDEEMPTIHDDFIVVNQLTHEWLTFYRRIIEVFPSSITRRTLSNSRRLRKSIQQFVVEFKSLTEKTAQFFEEYV